MTDYTANNSNQTITGFNPSTDDIIFPSSLGNAASYTVTQSGANATFTSATGNTLTLSGINLNQLTTANLVFAGGSQIIIGANSTTAALNSLPNAHTLTGAGGNQVYELGGNDTIVDNTTSGGNFIRGGSGNDTITISSTAINDTIIAGGGNTTINASAATGPETIWAANYAAYSGMGTANGGADSILAGTAGTYVHGSKGNVTIVGQAHTNNDTFIAGHGNDSIVGYSGGTGNLYFGGKGADTIDDTRSTGHDTIFGGVANVSAHGTVTYVGSGGNSSILGTTVTGVNDEYIHGGGGNATILTGAGYGSTIHGGKGADLITSASSGGGSTIYTDAGNSTVVASASATSADTIIGGSGTAVFTIGQAGATGRVLTILGGTGRETFNEAPTTLAREGTVNLVAGTGVDTFNIGLINSGAAVGSITNISGLKSTDAVNITTAAQDATGLLVTTSGTTITINNGDTSAHGDQLVISGVSAAGSIGVTNTAASTSTIYYNLTSTGASVGGASATGNNILIGGSGNDTVDSGTTGTDSINTGAGNDLVLLHTTSSTDTIVGGGGTDTLSITGANESLSLGAGHTTGFSNIIFAGTGTGTATITGSLVGGSITSSSTVTIDGSALTSAFTLTNTGDWGVAGLVIKAGASGNDSIDISTGNHTESATIGGGAGANTFVGDSGTDSIYGGSGNDTITSHDTIASTHDTIAAGTGVDDMTGNATAGVGTTFKFSTASLITTPTSSQLHTIENFNETNTDKFMIQGITPSSLVAGTNVTIQAVAGLTGGANATLATILASNTTAGAVELVTFAAADSSLAAAIGSSADTIANHGAILVIGLGGGNSTAIYLHGAQSHITSTATLAADFLTYA